MVTDTKEKPGSEAAEAAEETITAPDATQDAEADGAKKDGDGVPDGYVPKAEYEKVLAERDKHRKAENDLRSSEIQKLRDFNKGGTFEDLREDLAELKGAVAAFAKGENYDAYMESRAQERTEKEKKAVDGTFSQREDEAQSMIIALAEELKIDANKHEAFETTRVYINAARRAVKTGRPDGVAIGFYLLGQSIAEAERARYKIASATHDEDLKAEFKRGKQEGQRLREKDNATDNSTGPATGAGGPQPLNAFIKKTLSGMTNKEVAEYEKALNARLGLR